MPKPVFQTPVRLEDHRDPMLVAADCELICTLLDATPAEAMTIKDAINVLREIVDDASEMRSGNDCLVSANLIKRAAGLIYG